MAASPDGYENSFYIPAANNTNAKVIFIVKNAPFSLYIYDENQTKIYECNSSRMLVMLLYNTGTAWHCVELV